GITVVTARRVGSLRHGDASIVGRPGEHILSRQPAVIRLIPLDDDVAVVVTLAWRAEVLPEVCARERSSDEGSGGLVKHGIAEVYPLHHLGVAHRRVGVGRHKPFTCNIRAVNTFGSTIKTSNLSDPPRSS